MLDDSFFDKKKKKETWSEKFQRKMREIRLFRCLRKRFRFLHLFSRRCCLHFLVKGYGIFLQLQRIVFCLSVSLCFERSLCFNHPYKSSAWSFVSFILFTCLWFFNSARVTSVTSTSSCSSQVYSLLINTHLQGSSSYRLPVISTEKSKNDSSLNIIGSLLNVLVPLAIFFIQAAVANFNIKSLRLVNLFPCILKI